MKTVRYTSENLPKPTKKDWNRVASVRDEDIDCSDIPEFKDLSGFRPYADRSMYRPVKVAVTCKLDADIVAWLKQNGKGYQTRMNAILREVMVHEAPPPHYASARKGGRGAPQ